MKLRSLEEAALEGKTVLYRAPYDIELNSSGQLEDLSRIEATLPTLRYLIEKNCKIVILTYVGRPGGKVVESLRTTPHAQVLSKLLARPVAKADECVGEGVSRMIDQMSLGDLLMLENTRFHPEEELDDDGFALELCRNGELVVFDAFPQAHRAHASVTGIGRHLPIYAGYYCMREVNTLNSLLENPSQPFVLIIGGAKISDKVSAIENLYGRVARILVGGAVAHVFLKARGFDLGDSYLEENVVSQIAQETDWVAVAREIMEKDSEQKIVLPQDLIVSDDTHTFEFPLTPGAVVHGSAIDIGPITRALFTQEISQAQTIFWSGPLGKSESEAGREGSLVIAHALVSSPAQTVVAGGDTIAVVDQCGVRDQIKVVSLAGGASLQFLSGLPLLGLEPLWVQ